MRRRQPAHETAAEMPQRLQRFVLDEWTHVVPPEPDSWADGGHSFPWASFKARQAFGRARNDWRTVHGLGWWGRTPEGRARAATRLRGYGIEVR